MNTVLNPVTQYPCNCILRLSNQRWGDDAHVDLLNWFDQVKLTKDHPENSIFVSFLYFQTMSNSEKREHLFKVLVIGELGVGKTSFIKRYVHSFFSQNYRATIGVDFALKVLNWDPNTIIRLQLWDIAGKNSSLLSQFPSLTFS